MEARVPSRKVFSSWMEAKTDLNKWMKTTITNMSVSVWYYSELEKKFDKFGNFLRFGPRYSSAQTDKIFFDIDCVDKDGLLIEENYKGMRNIWDWAVKYDYRREIAFTSGGYQMTIGANLRPECYESVVKNVAKDNAATIDSDISLAMMRRVVGTYNIGKENKSARNTFCIPLTDAEVALPFHKHIELAMKQRKGLIYSGKNIYIPSNVTFTAPRKELDRRSDFTYDSSADEILLNYGYQYDDICKNIRSIVEQPRVGHYDRMLVIKYLKDIIGVKYGDMVILLPKILTARHDQGNDGTHSIDEGQVDSIYSRNLHFQPNKMKENGYCEMDCNICNDFICGLMKL